MSVQVHSDFSESTNSKDRLVNKMTSAIIMHCGHFPAHDRH